MVAAHLIRAPEGNRMHQMKPHETAKSSHIPRRDRLDPTGPGTATPADPHSHTCQSAQNKGHLSHVKPKVCANVERTRGLQSANQGELFHLDMQSRPRVLRKTLSDTALRTHHWSKQTNTHQVTVAQEPAQVRSCPRLGQCLSGTGHRRLAEN